MDISKWKRPIGAILQWLPGAVKAFVPPHERGVGNFIAGVDKVNAVAGPVELYGMKFCIKNMW